MMAFREIKTAILADVFTVAAVAGQFRVIGNQTQGQSADEVEGVRRSVALYYSAGDFSNRLTGPVQHKITFRFDLTVSAPAEADLSVINDPGATPAELIIAIDAKAEADLKADESMDELIELVYQIVMDARNNQLQLDKGLPAVKPTIVIDTRHIINARKDEPLARGELVVLTASMDLLCGVAEQVLGDTGTPAEGVETVTETAGIDDTENDIDSETRTGIEVPVVP